MEGQKHHETFLLEFRPSIGLIVKYAIPPCSEHLTPPPSVELRPRKPLVMTSLIQELEWTEEHEQRRAVDPYEIRMSELYWVARQPFFESRGYQLRPRYRPGWVKSWTTRVPGDDVEDGFTTSVCHNVSCHVKPLTHLSADVAAEGHGRNSYFRWSLRRSKTP